MRRTTIVVAAVAAMAFPALAEAPSFGLDGYYLHPHSGKYCNSSGTCIDRDDYDRGVERREHKYERIRESREDYRERRREEERREERAREERRDRDEEWVEGWIRDRGEREQAGYKCDAPVMQVGAEHDTKGAAQRDAQTAWSNLVRFNKGELWADSDNWGYPHLRCVRSSVAAKVGTVDLLDRHRCQIVAKPCRPPLRPMDK